MAKPLNYRRLLNGTGLATAAFPANISWPLPILTSSALSLEGISIINTGAINPLTANDQMVFTMGIGSVTSFLTGVGGPTGSFVPLAQASWIAAGRGMLIPPGVPSLKFDPPIRLTPGDNPVNFILMDETNDPGFNLIQGAIKAVVYGWEVPTTDLATFPSPITSDAIL